MEFEGYCVKCREKRTVTNGELKTSPNGRQMAQGKCPVCGTTVTRFMAGSGAGAGNSGGGKSKAASGSKQSTSSKAGAGAQATTASKGRSGK